MSECGKNYAWTFDPLGLKWKVSKCILLEVIMIRQIKVSRIKTTKQILKRSHVMLQFFFFWFYWQKHKEVLLNTIISTWILMSLDNVNLDPSRGIPLHKQESRRGIFCTEASEEALSKNFFTFMNWCKMFLHIMQSWEAVVTNFTFEWLFLFMNWCNMSIHVTL